MREWVVNGHVFFVNERRGTEKPAIFARLPGHRYPIQPIYLLIQEAHLKARFAATPEVEEIVQANFDKFFTQAATEVAANDLLRGTGVRVKL
jgi:hypothetical protein